MNNWPHRFLPSVFPYIVLAMSWLGICVAGDSHSATQSPCATCPLTDRDIWRGWQVVEAINADSIIVHARRTGRIRIKTKDVDSPPASGEVVRYSPWNFDEIDEWRVHWSDAATQSCIKSGSIIRVVAEPRYTGFALEESSADGKNVPWSDWENRNFTFFSQDNLSDFGDEAIMAVAPVSIGRGISQNHVERIQAVSATIPVFAMFRGNGQGFLARSTAQVVAIRDATSAAMISHIRRDFYQRYVANSKSIYHNQASIAPYEDYIMRSARLETIDFSDFSRDLFDLLSAFRSNSILPTPRTLAGRSVRHYLLMKIAGQSHPQISAVQRAMQHRASQEVAIAKTGMASSPPRSAEVEAVIAAKQRPEWIVMRGRVASQRDHVVTFQGRERLAGEWADDPATDDATLSDLAFVANNAIRLRVDEIIAGTASAQASGIATGHNISVAASLLHGIGIAGKSDAMFTPFDLCVDSDVIVVAHAHKPTMAQVGATHAMRLSGAVLATDQVQGACILDCRLIPSRLFKNENDEAFLSGAKDRQRARHIQAKRVLPPQESTEAGYRFMPMALLSRLGSRAALDRPEWNSTLSDLRLLFSLKSATASFTPASSLGKDTWTAISASASATR